jgi:hypothetical protein
LVDVRKKRRRPPVAGPTPFDDSGGLDRNPVEKFGAAHHRRFAIKSPTVKDMTLEQKIGIGFWVGVSVFMLSQILLVVFAIAFFLGHFVWPQ